MERSRKVFGFVQSKKLRSQALVLAAWCVGWQAVGQAIGTVRWSIGTGQQVVSSPAIGPDGNIYIGCGTYQTTGAFYSISPFGTTNWVFRPGAAVAASPAFGADGTLYVPCENGQMYALTLTGETNWVFQAGGQYLSSPAVGVDGTIYLNSLASDGTNRLYSVSPTGATNWVFTTGRYFGYTSPQSQQFPSPAIGRDGTVYVPSLDGNLYAVSPSGKTNWLFGLGNSNFAYSSPTIGPDGTIYVGSDLGTVYALSPSGVKKWGYTTPTWVESSAALTPAGDALYIGSGSGGLYCLSTNGARIWSANIGMISASAAVSATYPNPAGGGNDGNVYVTTLGGNYLYALSLSGTVHWKLVLSGSAFSSPAIGSDGTIYVGGGTQLYAVYGTNALADSPWPMFRRDLRHQARAVQCALQPLRVLPDGNMAVGLTVETDRTYVVQVSTNLLNWAVMSNLTSSTSETQVFDLEATNFLHRYYRLLAP